MIVADTNLVVYLLIPGEFTESVKVIYAGKKDWVAPFSCRAEFLNVMSTCCRSKKLSVNDAVEAYKRADRIVSDVPVAPDPGIVLELSVKSGIAGYDTLFVAAAKMSSLPLVTFDQALHRTFPETAIAPEGLEEWWQKNRKG